MIKGQHWIVTDFVPVVECPGVAKQRLMRLA
jgi:hypothetical protein